MSHTYICSRNLVVNETIPAIKWPLKYFDILAQQFNMITFSLIYLWAATHLLQISSNIEQSWQHIPFSDSISISV